MLNRLDLRGAGSDLAARLPRPDPGGAGPVAAVEAILADVRARGDEAVRDLTERFDGVRLDDLRVPVEQVGAALARTAPALRDHLEVAAAGVADFARSQLPADTDYERGGIRIRGLHRPVDRAGCYVPGGRARYPSTVLMTAVIAKVAGVPEVARCVPPERSGAVADVTLAAAAIAGVDEVYGIGGAQAIAALAYGTASVRPVDVVVGPGNVYVALAKRLVAGEGRVGVPSAFAGPSEVVVVADASAPPAYAAVDVILQAEHGPGGLAWLVTWDADVAEAVTAEIGRQVAASPRRAEIESTFAGGGWCAIVDGPEQAMDVCNLIAPEHLELMVEDPDALVKQVRHAGAVFCGPWAPASVGDYLAGPSHVLPTFGSARFSSALTVRDFQKDLHVITLDEPTLAAVGPHVIGLAEAEGLSSHAESVRLRMGPGRHGTERAGGSARMGGGGGVPGAAAAVEAGRAPDG
ncbi:MAG: histidinol dehydrogenase [Actinobacteria bacterium]|nr:histidinol dehydrogenase [Actinomycetota bacterium]